MNKVINGGNIITRQKIRINNKDTVNDLSNKTTRVGLDLLKLSIGKIKSGEVKTIQCDISQGKYRSYPNRNELRAFLKKEKRYFNSWI